MTSNDKDMTFILASHYQYNSAEKDIASLSMVPFKICQHHLVQYVILIQMVYERSRGHKIADHWKYNTARF